MNKIVNYYSNLINLLIFKQKNWGSHCYIVGFECIPLWVGNTFNDNLLYIKYYSELR